MAKENKAKICNICKKEIITPGDEYCILSQYKKDGKLHDSAYYHVSCFVERYMVKSQLDELMGRTMKVLQQAEARFS